MKAAGDVALLLSGALGAYIGVVVVFDRRHYRWASVSLGAVMLVGVIGVIRLLTERNYGGAALFAFVFWMVAFVGSIVHDALLRTTPEGPSEDYLKTLGGMAGILFFVGFALTHAG